MISVSQNNDFIILKNIQQFNMFEMLIQDFYQKSKYTIQTDYIQTR